MIVIDDLYQYQWGFPQILCHETNSVIHLFSDDYWESPISYLKLNTVKIFDFFTPRIISKNSTEFDWVWSIWTRKSLACSHDPWALLCAVFKLWFQYLLLWPFLTVKKYIMFHLSFGIKVTKNFCNMKQLLVFSPWVFCYSNPFLKPFEIHQNNISLTYDLSCLFRVFLALAITRN